MKDIGGLMEKEKNTSGPAHGGNFNGYNPEYRSRDSGDDPWRSWRSIPIDTIEGKGGVPHPIFQGHILKSLSLYGHAQAKALMWMFLADIKASWKVVQVEARVQKYQIVYDLKSNKVDEPEIEKDKLFE